MTEPDPPFYGPDGETISHDAAIEMILDPRSRTVGAESLWLAGHEVQVRTVFVPVDMSQETWGRVVDTPTCWISEIIGGPDDMNGTVEYSVSRAAALDAHRRMVERAIASGCSL